MIDSLSSSRRKMLMGGMAVLMLSPAALNIYHALRPQGPLYIHQGIEGPYLAIMQPDGTPGVGQRISSVRAGSEFAVISNFCVQTGVSMKGEANLVREGEPGREASIVSTTSVFLSATERRCGPKVFHIGVPIFAKPGPYRLERRVTLTSPQGRTLSAELPALPLQITPPSVTPEKSNEVRH